MDACIQELPSDCDGGRGERLQDGDRHAGSDLPMDAVWPFTSLTQNIAYCTTPTRASLDKAAGVRLSVPVVHFQP